MINTIKHLAYELKAREIDLLYIVNNIGNFYYKKQEVKTKDGFPQIKNGIVQTRTLYPSKSMLKDIQKRIIKNIFSHLTFPDYAYGSIAGRDNIANTKKHLNNKYFFTTDLKKFFPTITNKMVFEMFCSFRFSPTVSRILTRLVTYKGGVPQGAPTSPAIANLVFIKTGNILQEFANMNNLTFTTYLDDITFSSLYNFKEISQFIIQTLQENGYKINHNKTNYNSGNVVITGILIKNKILSITDKYRQKLIHTNCYNPRQIKAYSNYALKIDKSNY